MRGLRGDAPVAPTRPAPAIRNPQFRPRVIVKFVDEIDLPGEPDRSSDGLHRIPGGSEWLRVFPGLAGRPLFSRSEEWWARLLAQARQSDPSYRPPNFGNFIALTVPRGVAGQAVLDIIRQGAESAGVERVSLEPGPLPPPTVDALDDPQSTEQGYLDSADAGGIDARFAWGHPGGAGEGQSLADFEWGWNLDHEDLVDHRADILTGENYSAVAHGTGVLGVIAASDNKVGCVGIASKIASVRCASPWTEDASGVWTFDRYVALLDCVDQMEFGHVLLIEDQIEATGYPEGVPIENDATLYELLRLATALGIVVIEAAGNGNADLDTLVDADGRMVLNPDSPDFRDSGAILVGAASSTPPHPRHEDSGHGKRIDCFAWGDDVFTLSSNEDRVKRDMYDTAISRTSGASAIIAGAALVVQGLAASKFGTGFNGWVLRDILANCDLGTGSSSGCDVIGVMPDLKRIIESDVIGLAPDVFVRDFVGDSGDLNEEAHATCPDVFVLTAPAVDPNLEYGEGSGREDEAPPADVVSGVDQFVHVRLRNRGAVDVANVDATVYWSPPSSLLDPTDWTLVGTITIPLVPADGSLTVSDAITWPAAAVPASGHYCFVVLVGHPADPAPQPAQFVEWSRFERYVRVNNNVGWRNFHVVEYGAFTDAVAPLYMALPFRIVGAWDDHRAMGFEIGGQLPRSASLRLELPAEAFDLLRLPRRRGVEVANDANRLQYPIPPRFEIREIPLPRGTRIHARLLVHVPDRWRVFHYDVFARQTHHGEEVGRITWRLSPPRSRRPG